MGRGRIQTGFTIVELLIVIVVIAILAAISIVAYNGIQERAKGATIASDVQTINTGLHLLASEQGRSTWWFDKDVSGYGPGIVPGDSSPTIEEVIQVTNLKDYMRGRSNVEGTGSAWRYDSDPEGPAGEPLGSNPGRTRVVMKTTWTA